MTIPITVIGGYLGAGKTTLVNRVLAAVPQLQHLAILVNDFGSINIDERLLKGRNPHRQIIGLANGCVCCSIGDDFSTRLLELADLGISHVLLEASGVALPDKVKRQCRLPGFHPHLCLVLVDAVNHLPRLQDKYVGQLAATQVQQADQLVVTKAASLHHAAMLNLPAATKQWHVDDPALLPAILAPELAPELTPEFTPEMTCGHTIISTTKPTTQAPEQQAQLQMGSISSITLRPLAALNRAELETLLTALPAYVQRAKGFIFADGNWLQVQWVTATKGQVQISPFTPLDTAAQPPLASELVLLCPAAEVDRLVQHLHRISAKFQVA